MRSTTKIKTQVPQMHRDLSRSQYLMPLLSNYEKTHNRKRKRKLLAIIYLN